MTSKHPAAGARALVGTVTAVAFVGMIDEQERDAVHAFDRERRAEAQEQHVARLPPELQEKCARCQRGRDDHTE